MSTVVKTWSWGSDAEGWASRSWMGSFGYVTADQAIKMTGTFGPIAGDVAEGNGEIWSPSGVTWETIGVPAGATVTSVQITGWKRKAVTRTRVSTWSGHAYMVDSLGSNIFSGSNLASLTLPGSTDSAYTAMATGSPVAVNAAYSASNTAVRFVVYLDVQSTVDNSAIIDLRFDDFQITITYTTAGENITPTKGSVVVGGHAPVLVRNPTDTLWPFASDAQGWITRGLDPRVTASYSALGYGGGVGGCLEIGFSQTSGPTGFVDEVVGSRDGDTWESWGVPAGCPVIDVAVTGYMYSLISATNVSVSLGTFTEVSGGDWSAWVTLRPTGLDYIGGSTPGTWQTASSQLPYNVQSPYVDSSTPVRLIFAIRFQALDSIASAVVRVDEIHLAILYGRPGAVIKTPGVAHVVLSGHAPVVRFANLVTPGIGRLSLAGHPAYVTYANAHLVQPYAGSVVASAHSPAVSVTENHWITPGCGHLAPTGHAPTLFVSHPGLTIAVDGVERTAYIDQPSKIRILDSRNALIPDIKFSVQSWLKWKPSPGCRVWIADGSEVFFSGRITQVTISRRSKDGNALWYYDCAATGSRYLLTKSELVFGHYKSTITPPVTVTVAAVLADVVSHLPAGFTANHLDVRGNITEISFGGVSVDAALMQLAQTVGASYFVDEYDDVHFYMDADPGAVKPDTITENNARDVTLIADGSQLVTRQYVRGYGTTVADYYTGMLVVSNGVGADDVGAVVMGNEQWCKYHQKLDVPVPVAPSLDYAYKPGSGWAAPSIFTVNRSGSTVEVQTFFPHNLSVGSTVKIVGATPSDYNGVWKITKVPASNVFWFEISGTPTATGSGGYAFAATSGSLSSQFAYVYGVTFSIGTGETLLSPTNQIFVWSGGAYGTGAAVTPPANMGSGGQTTGGNMAVGNYAYGMSFVTSMGETLTSPPGTIAISGGNNAFAFTALPLAPDERVVSRNIYRSKVGTLSPLYLVATINDNTTRAWTDTAADDSLGAQTSPESNTAGYGAVSLYNIPICPYSNLAVRKIYRSQNGIDFFLVGTINNNIDTTWCDTQPDSPVGARAPVVNTAPSLLTLTPPYPAEAISVGDQVGLIVQCDDVAAQAALAALDGSDGIRVGPLITDTSLSMEAARVRGNAELAIRSVPEHRLTCVSLDPKIRAGQIVIAAVNGSSLFAPGVASPGMAGEDSAISGQFRVLSCEILGYDLGPTAQITRRITASDLRFTPADLLAQWEATTNWRPIGYTGVATR